MQGASAWDGCHTSGQRRGVWCPTDSAGGGQIQYSAETMRSATLAVSLNEYIVYIARNSMCVIAKIWYAPPRIYVRAHSGLVVSLRQRTRRRSRARRERCAILCSCYFKRFKLSTHFVTMHFVAASTRTHVFTIMQPVINIQTQLLFAIIHRPVSISCWFLYGLIIGYCSLFHMLSLNEHTNYRYLHSTTGISV